MADYVVPLVGTWIETRMRLPERTGIQSRSPRGNVD